MSNVFDKINHLTVGSCTCMTKTDDIYYHDEKCRYRLLREIYSDVERIFHYNGELCSFIVQKGITPPGWKRIEADEI